MLAVKIRRQSLDDDYYSLHFGQHVAIYDLTRSDADRICSTYRKFFASQPRDEPGYRSEAASDPVRHAA
jgi:hypothetical protein